MIYTEIQFENIEELFLLNMYSILAATYMLWLHTYVDTTRLQINGKFCIHLFIKKLLVSVGLVLFVVC